MAMQYRRRAANARNKAMNQARDIADSLAPGAAPAPTSKRKRKSASKRKR